ncbi:MAG: ATP-binding cassette domain-containing protein [Candidatus Kapabacteria bacterium]|nr:ATP-binding cassette domain-containing protein [Candidatus Kapabacteria bacterium]
MAIQKNESNSVIEVKNLVKRYKKADKNAVDDISFDIKKGEFFAFLGPNGAGKTTTISILTTTLNKTSGDVKIAGYDLEKENKFVRQRIGIIFQNPSLDLNLTAEENIRLHSSLYGLYNFRPFYKFMPNAYKDRVNYLAEIIGLKDELFKEVKSFSGGMKRKLEIIRSLIHRPEVLFLDEPSTGLDPVSRNDLWKYLKTVRNEDGTTIFLTTHYLEEAEEADNVCIINHGKIISFGTPNQLKQNLVEEIITIDADNRDALRSELNKLNLEYKEENGFKVKYNNDITPFRIIKSIETPLTTMDIHEPSLEDTYIKLIGMKKEEIK